MSAPNLRGRVTRRDRAVASLPQPGHLNMLPPIPNPPTQPARRSRRARPKARTRAGAKKPGTATAAGCLRDYLAAFERPFDVSNICFPHSPAIPSAKYPVWAKGTLTLGTQGTGMILVQPTGANDVNSVWTSNGSFAQADAKFNTGTVAGVDGHMFTNNPYASAAISSSGVQWRCALIAVRVRYIGTNLNMSGRTVSFVDPHHHNINDQSLDTTLSYAGVHSLPVNREWKTIRAMPQQPAEFDYADTPNVTNGWSACMGLQIEGVQNEKYEFEVVQHAEYIGVGAQNFATTSEAHPWTSTAVSALNSMGRGALETGKWAGSLASASPHLWSTLFGDTSVASVARRIVEL